jgi:hypothetical protein
LGIDQNKDQALNPFFDINGFSSMNLAINMGSTFAFLFALTTSLALFGILKLLSMMCPIFAPRESFTRKMQWSYPLRFLIQQFFPVYTSALINLYEPDILRNDSFFYVLSMVIVLGLPVILCLLSYQIRKHKQS